MLSIGKLNAEQAQKYFTDEKAQYYTGENSEAKFSGKANSLTGTTLTKENFKEFISKSKHKINSFDLTFSAPKSFSILAETSNQELREKLINLHIKAADSAMAKIEQDATFRLFFTNDSGERQYINVPAGGLSYASFIHHSSRMQDMQLHTHNVVLNSIMHNNKEYSIDARYFYQNQREYSKLYRSELINLLTNNNINVKITDYENLLFEIEGISSEDINNFSKQSKNIDSVIEDLKKQYPNADIKELREKANLSTRAAKNHDIKIEDLRESWKKELLHNIETEPTEFQKASAGYINKSLNAASEKLTEFQATFSILELENAIRQDLIINRRSWQDEDIKTVIQEQVKNNILLSESGIYTTAKMRNAEIFIENFAQKKGTQNPIMDIKTAELKISDWEKNNFILTRGQKDSVVKVLTSRAELYLFQGNAGVGKTAALKCLNDILQNNNILQGLSTTGKAAAEIQSASNIESSTLDSFLLNKNDMNGKIYVIDESSMNSTLKLQEIIEHAEKTNSRVILQGDIKQLPSISAGGMFERLLNDESIEKTVNEESLRQKTDLMKSVISDISKNKITEGLDKLDEAGKILEFTDKNELYKSISNSYIEKGRTDNLILAQMNVDRKNINELVRERLKQNNKIDSNEQKINVKSSKNFSNYMKKYAYNYRQGDIVIYNKREYTVDKIDEKNNEIYIKNGGLVKSIPALSRNEIYENAERNFSKGDKIVFLKNENLNGVKIKNGHTAYIQQIEKNADGNFDISAKTETGKIVNFNTSKYNFFDSGYCVTDYKSQGQTTPEVLIYSNGATRENLYVELSRAKQNAEIYTLNKEKLYLKSEISQKQIDSITKFKNLIDNNKIIKKILHKSVNKINDKKNINIEKSNEMSL